MKIISHRILLLGDHCIDYYNYGTVLRISPEAPVPIFQYQYQEFKEGMASNVCKNLQALSCTVDFLKGNKTSTKTRLVDLRTKQQLLRIDNDLISDPIDIDKIKSFDYDAMVISDYDKGSITYELIDNFRSKYNGPIFLDTKKVDLNKFDNIFVKINELEYKNLKSYNKNLIVTLGKKGAMYKTTTETLFPTNDVEVSDVCGAGDTFLAALTYQYLVTKDMGSAINFANKASSIAIQHFGNYAPTLKEIL